MCSLLRKENKKNIMNPSFKNSQSEKKNKIMPIFHETCSQQSDLAWSVAITDARSGHSV